MSETKWSSLLARTRALILYILISKFDFGPEKLLGLSRNGPLVLQVQLPLITPHPHHCACFAREMSAFWPYTSVNVHVICSTCKFVWVPGTWFCCKLWPQQSSNLYIVFFCHFAKKGYKSIKPIRAPDQTVDGSRPV